MIKKIYLFLLWVITLILSIQCQNVKKSFDLFDEESAQQLVEQVNDVFRESAISYRNFSENDLSPELLMRAKLRPFFDTLLKYDWNHFQNVLLKRQFKILLRGAKYPPIDYEFKRATHILKSISRQKWACSSKTPKKCDMAFVHHIKTIFTNSNDLNEIKYYWMEWRNKLPSEVKEALHFYVGYYQNMSTSELKPSAIWYDQYEDPNFIDELEGLMETLRPFYIEMHAHMRNVLRIKYGDDVIPATGLIPHHLLEQLTYQAWKKDSVLRNPFPQKKLPNLQAEMSEAGYVPYDLVNISAQFFASIGFQNLTEDFIRDHIHEMEPGSGGPDCKSRIFDYGEIELNYCPKVYYKKLLQTHGDIAMVEYALARNKMHVGLNQEACPGFGNAIGEAVILSASTPLHLQQKLGLLKDYEYDDLLNLNRLYRLAVHTLLTLPTYFVHEKLWIEMIDGKVSPKEYNCRYWNLMQKYMGVDTSLQTNSNTYDMPYKFYEGIIDQYRSTKKLLGEFLGYQIYRAICLNIGEFQRGNAYKVLDNCDFANNKLAGTLISDMMNSGSTKSWREIIKPLSIKQNTKLSGTAFLEYFDSLHQWLIEENLNNNIKVGWMNFNKCEINKQ